jgi:hypothetical protein
MEETGMAKLRMEFGSVFITIENDEERQLKDEIEKLRRLVPSQPMKCEIKAVEPVEVEMGRDFRRACDVTFGPKPIEINAARDLYRAVFGKNMNAKFVIEFAQKHCGMRVERRKNGSRVLKFNP